MTFKKKIIIPFIASLIVSGLALWADHTFAKPEDGIQLIRHALLLLVTSSTLLLLIAIVMEVTDSEPLLFLRALKGSDKKTADLIRRIGLIYEHFSDEAPAFTRRCAGIVDQAVKQLEPLTNELNQDGKKWVKKISLPFVVSLILTGLVVLVDYEFASRMGEAVEVDDLIRNGLMFFVTSSTLAFVIAIVVEVSDSEPRLLLKVLADSDKRTTDLLRRIALVYERLGDEDPALTQKCSETIDQAASQLESLADNHYEYDAKLVLEETEQLIGDTKTKIEAVSMVDLKEYWAKDELGTVAIAQQRKAKSKGVYIERILLLQREEEIVIYKQTLEKMQKAGMHLYYVLLKDVPEQLRRDFAIYDVGRYIQHFQFDPTDLNKRYLHSTVDRRSETVKEHRFAFDNLRSISKPLDIASEILSSARQGKELWTHGPILKHYNEGLGPNLHLEKLRVQPRSVLDVGCGAGRCLKQFVDLDCEITAMDYDEKALELCKKKYPGRKIDLIQERFGVDSLQGKMFDLIISYNAIYHGRKEELDSAIRRVFDLLKPGGYFLLTLKTLAGNDEAFDGAYRVNSNGFTYASCKVPDFENLHTFSTEKEIEEVEKLFGLVVYKETIPLIHEGGVIVQLQGYYLILQKVQGDEQLNLGKIL